MPNYELILGQSDRTRWCVAVIGSVADMDGYTKRWSTAGFTVRKLRGRKMRHYPSLFDEFGAALQLPWYFGENGNAFDECIADLSWLAPGAGYVFVISQPELTVIDTDDDGLAWLVRVLSRAAHTWATPVTEHPAFDRPAVPFHVVLQIEPGDRQEARATWRAAGAEIG